MSQATFSDMAGSIHLYLVVWEANHVVCLMTQPRATCCRARIQDYYSETDAMHHESVKHFD